MTVVGVDLSTRAIDLVALDEDNPAICEHLSVPLTGEWWHSARNMRKGLQSDLVPEWLDEKGVHLVGVERPYGKQVKAVAALYTIMGAFLASMPPSVMCFEVSPAQMRQELGLPGNCGKAAMHEAVLTALCHWEVIEGGIAYRSGGNRFWPDDALDAWAAGYAALRINERAAKEAA